VKTLKKRATGSSWSFQPGDDHDRPELAERDLIEPITPEIVASHREGTPRHSRRFALLPTMGGQTALNCALSLPAGTLEKFDIEMIAPPPTHRQGEDRQRSARR